MSGKPKPWVSHPGIPGLQTRTYGSRRVYRLRQRFRGRLYVDYLGEMPLSTAARFVKALRAGRSDPALLARIYEEIRAVTQPGTGSDPASL